MSLLPHEASQESSGSATRTPQEAAQQRGNAHQHFDALQSSRKARPAPKGPPRQALTGPPPDSLQNHVPGSPSGDMNVPPSSRGFPRELWERPKKAPTGRPEGERQPTFRRPRPTPRRLPEAFQRLPRRPVRPEEAPKKFEEAPKGPQASPKTRPQASHKIMFPDGLPEHDS